MRVEDRPAAVLFADVVGSTGLYERLGDAEALRRVQDCLSALEGCATRAGGEVVKTIGDEVMCIFADAASAALAATDMQATVSGLPAPDGSRVSVRIGFHVGPLLRTAGDAFGDTVNVAARIAGLAKARQILATDAACGALPAHLHPLVRPLGGVTLKGRNAGIRICELLWDPSTEMTLVFGDGPCPAKASHAAVLHLRLDGRTWALATGTLTIGRDAASDVAVRSPRASRQHARVEARGDRFVLVDLSTNGTFVLGEDGEQFQVRREEHVLRGRGRIAFGVPVDADAGDTLAYDCAG